MRHKLNVIAHILWMILLATPVMVAHADALDSLQTFLSETKSAHMQFTQITKYLETKNINSNNIGHIAAEQALDPNKSEGIFVFQRPDKFRFVYYHPFRQTIIADGTNLWVYDEDLEQIIKRDQTQALNATPASLIATASSISNLRASFKLQIEPEHDGLQWVIAQPISPNGTITMIKLGLLIKKNITSRNNIQNKGAPNLVQIKTLEIKDSFGQVSILHFDNIKNNPTLKETEFSFTPPPGVVILYE